MTVKQTSNMSSRNTHSSSASLNPMVVKGAKPMGSFIRKKRTTAENTTNSSTSAHKMFRQNDEQFKLKGGPEIPTTTTSRAAAARCDDDHHTIDTSNKKRKHRGTFKTKWQHMAEKRRLRRYNSESSSQSSESESDSPTDGEENAVTKKKGEVEGSAVDEENTVAEEVDTELLKTTPVVDKKVDQKQKGNIENIVDFIPPKKRRANKKKAAVDGSTDDEDNPGKKSLTVVHSSKGGSSSAADVQRRALLKRDRDALCRMKSQELYKTLTEERRLRKIATYGVVQLFNAVREHQSEVKSKMKSFASVNSTTNTPSVFKQDKVLKEMAEDGGKRFQQKLAKQSSVVSSLKRDSRMMKKEENDFADEQSIKGDGNAHISDNDLDIIHDDDSQIGGWKALRDDFMMASSTLKDWDKSDEDIAMEDH